MAEIDSRKAALIAELEVSRGEFRRALRRLESSLDLVERARHSMRRNIWSWMLAGTLGGFLFSGWWNRKDSVRGSGSEREDVPQGRTSAQGGENRSPKRKKIWFSVAKLAFELAQPHLMDWLGGALSKTHWFAPKETSLSTDTPYPNPDLPNAKTSFR